MRRVVFCGVLLVLGVCLSGCLFSTHWQGYGSATGYLYISGNQQPDIPPVVHLGMDPPDGFVPWAFACVKILDIQRETTADAYGGFTLPGIPEGRHILSVSDGQREWRYEYHQPASAVVFGSPGARRCWTVMVYMIGDNSLGGAHNFLVEDLNEMEAAHFDPSQISVLAFADPLNVWDTVDQSACYEPPDYAGARVFEITRESPGSSAIVSPVVASPRDSSAKTQTDSVDPEVLSSFVRWCTTFYPAEQYALVLWDHGDGIAIHNGPSSEDAQAKAIGPDQNGSTDAPGRFMDVDQISCALSGLKVDLIVFDACLMGGVEVAYELRHCADVVVASEEVILGPGWDYKDALERLSPVYDAWSFGVALVDSYEATYRQYSGTFPEGLTCSAVQTGALSELVNAIDLLSQSLVEGLVDPLKETGVRSGIMSALYSTTRFGYRPGNPHYNHHYYDLDDLCRELVTGLESSGWGLPGAEAGMIAHNAGLVSQWFESSELNACLYSRRIGPADSYSARGLSVYCAPENTWGLGNPGYDYDQCEFAQDTRWFDVLKRL